MLRTFPRLTLSIALLACTGAAVAQTSAQSVPAVSQPTPQTPQTAPAGQPPTERIETDTPATNVDPRRGTQIRENRNNRGEVTSIEVQSGPSRYTMKSGQPVGNAQPGDAQSSSIRAPQWQVMEFDLNGKRKAAADAEAAAAAAGAPATPTTATASATANATGKPVAGAMPTAVPAATTPMLRPAEIPPPPPLPTTR